MVADFSESRKEKCARCKALKVFNCEHNTTVRDELQTSFAEEGRFYMAPRRSKTDKENSDEVNPNRSNVKNSSTKAQVSNRSVKQANNQKNRNLNNQNFDEDESQNEQGLDKDYPNESNNQINKKVDAKNAKKSSCCVIT